jgi:3-oxoadipate CoA-transferase beta subunit
MDLTIGAKHVVVVMTLFANHGMLELIPECTYPLTGVGCVARVYTDHAIFVPGADRVGVLEAYGITLSELARRLDVPVQIVTDAV